MKDKLRTNVITAIMDGKLDIEDAGSILWRSVRQIFRIGMLHALIEQKRVSKTVQGFYSVSSISIGGE